MNTAPKAAQQQAPDDDSLEAKIVSRPLTPQEIHDYDLPEETQVSGGLYTVGVGSAVYLEALVAQGENVSEVIWELTQKPDGSTATLDESPLGTGIPTYNPADQTYWDVAERKLFTPDIEGRYEVTGTMVTPNGQFSTTRGFTAGTYIGVGIVAKASPAFPECATCHSDKAASWAETRHATKFTREISGEGSSHYNSDCIKCHTVGFNDAPTADNGGFDDLARELNWTFPETLEPANWETMADKLKTLSNIQCENCHGPGSEHVAGDKKPNITVSFSSADCAQCHDEKPYHTKNIEWNQSAHAVTTRYPTGEGRSSCVGCHSAIGFIDRMNGVPVSERRTDYEAITCASCHDPHDAANPHQLRKVDDVTLENGAVISQGGTGKICMNCHMSRRDANRYVQEYHRHYGPHNAPQADMLAGTNAVDYDRFIPSSGHLYATEDSCASCHMQETSGDDPAHNIAGGHTFKLASDIGTPDDTSDDVKLLDACQKCHGPVEDFDFVRQDFNGDGVAEGVQTEIGHLMDELGRLLPPIGDVAVEVTEDYKPEELKAAYNYLFVEKDGSKGVHNTAYAVGILKAAIADLGGTGGDGQDTDNDGLPDSWETAHWGDISAHNGEGDADGDGASNKLELAAGTDPTQLDSDSDGFNDLAEMHAGHDPLNANDTPDSGSRIYHAAEFVFFSQTGKTYRVQAVSELGTDEWVNISDPIEGTGDMVQMFISTRENPKEFYRVVEIE